MTFHVDSEVGTLRQVIVHRPGLELGRGKDVPQLEIKTEGILVDEPGYRLQGLLVRGRVSAND